MDRSCPLEGGVYFGVPEKREYKINIKFIHFAGTESAFIQQNIHVGLQVVFSRYRSLLRPPHIPGMDSVWLRGRVG